MTPSERILRILVFVATYGRVTRAMIQEACLPHSDKEGRVARKILNRLVYEGLLQKTHGEVVFSDRNGAAAPVYYLPRRGAEMLACELRDDRWLAAGTLTPNWQNLLHSVAVAQFHILTDQAVALMPDAKVESFVNEWDIANAHEKDPAKRYRLFTEIRHQPRLVCAPDLAYLLSYRGFRKVYFVEIDRQTSGTQQIANSKTPGYAAMAEQQLHRRIFPNTNIDDFSVLSVSLTVNRRDALRRAIASKASASLWKFLAWSEMTPQTLLTGPILWSCTDGPRPLIDRSEGGTP